MKITNKIFQRAFTSEFYSQNAMFFLVVLGLAFGFMRDKEHKALAEFITALPICTLIPIGIWTFYASKIISFNIRTSHLEEMSFVFDLVLMPWRQRIVPLLLVSMNQFAPAIAYGIFLILMGVKNQAWLPVAVLVGSLVAFVFVITIYLHRSIRHPQFEMKVSGLKSWLDNRSERNHTRIFSEWLVRSHPGMVFFTKAASGVLLFAVCQLYKYDTYDYRLLAMAALISFSSMIAMVYQYVLFESSHFDIMRNLPISISTRILQFILCMAAVSVPDVIVLGWFYPEYLSLARFVEIVVFGLSLLLAGYCFLLRKNIAFESLTTVLFFAGMMLFLLILMKVPLLVLSGAFFVYVAISYRRNFYGFEVIVDKGI
ncbi:MAG TPA: hypothetical protein VG737_17200 [Cyclobacteriaceae bacterium]|nr:hypothetical protein [Cyclobacteriaceae bacterium]